jgi:hypothetical protein
MTERKGFFLAPSKFGKPPGTEDEGPAVLAKPKFTGFKQSKLGLLAESKFTPSSNSVLFGSPGGGGVLNTPPAAAAPVSAPPTLSPPTKSEEKEAAPPKVKPATFSFTPLTKPVSNSLAGTTSDQSSAAPQQHKENENKVAGPVFGDNLKEKVLLPPTTTEQILEPQRTPDKETKDLGFSSVTATPAGAESECGGEGGKTLSEAAAELTQQTNSNKRKYEQVTVVTGEEEESNVLKCNVKLFIFDSANRNWMERGRGVLRLNDSPNSTPGHVFSRLVMRTHGTQRVVLNTKLWPEMVCEKVNDKNIRISAWDENIIKIFLISLSPKEGETLHHALECRLNQLKHEKEEEGEGHSTLQGKEDKTELSPKSSTEGETGAPPAPLDDRDDSGEPSSKRQTLVHPNNQ